VPPAAAGPAVALDLEVAEFRGRAIDAAQEFSKHDTPPPTPVPSVSTAMLSVPTPAPSQYSP